MHNEATEKTPKASKSQNSPSSLLMVAVELRTDRRHADSLISSSFKDLVTTFHEAVVKSQKSETEPRGEGESWKFLVETNNYRRISYPLMVSKSNPLTRTKLVRRIEFHLLPMLSNIDPRTSETSIWLFNCKPTKLI